MISAGYITDAGPSSTGILSKDEIVQLESSKKNLASIHINMNVYHIIDVGKLSKEEAIKLEESHLFDIHAYEKASETIIKEIEACIMNAQKDISLYEHKKALYETIQKEKENKSEALKTSLANRLFSLTNKSASNTILVDQSQKSLNPRCASIIN